MTKVMTVAAAALIDGEGRVLMQRRPAGKQHAGLWELPGGKVEADESVEAALARELHEELGILVAPDAMRALGFVTAPAGERQLLLLGFVVEDWTGTPRALDADAIAWVTSGGAAALPMPPADRPLIAALAKTLGG